jgi:hypothetical protein
VAELETQVLDSKLEIDSLKASPVVSDEVDCADCSIFLADLTLFKEKHAWRNVWRREQFVECEI